MFKVVTFEGTQEVGDFPERFETREEAEAFVEIESTKLENDGFRLVIVEEI